ncbi:MAG: ribulose-phosphate 3-epimerase [Planctomycetes bacterium]|nr:ribulose-phosphate 3-epimerase [Planctomycetota bacterium]
MRRAVRIAPSLLAADFARLGEEIEAAQRGGADLLHVDIMDGHFVPNLTMGPCVVEAIRRVARIPLDVHLMIERPDIFAGPFIDAGADHITFHIEAPVDAARLVREIRGRGKTVGLSVRPATPVRACAPLLADIDLFLVMTVEPGFGGQPFRIDALDKIREAAALREELGASYAIEVDGGIALETIAEARRRGAEVIVAGTSIFRRPDVTRAIAELRAAAEAADAEAGREDGEGP